MSSLLWLLFVSASPEPLVSTDPLPASRPVTFQARLVEHLVSERPWEQRDTRFVAASTLALELGYAPAERWELSLATRLRHRLEIVADGDVGGDFLPEVRRALVRWYAPCGPELALGMDIVRWGRTLGRPFDLVSPIDWREGPLAPEGDDRVPVFAASLRQPLGAGELTASWLPFYFAARYDFGVTPVGPTQDVLHSSELALRVTQRLGALDLGLGYVFGFDRAPTPVEDAVPRRHALGLEAAFASGVLRLAAEAALLSSQRLFFLPDLISTSDPAVRWAFDVAVAPGVALDLTVGIEGLHAFADGGERALFEGPEDLWLRARLQLLLAFDGALRLDAETRVGLLRDDWWLTPSLEWRASTALTLGLGVAFFGGADDGFGDVHGDADRLWLRLVVDL